MTAGRHPERPPRRARPAAGGIALAAPSRAPQPPRGGQGWDRSACWHDSQGWCGGWWLGARRRPSPNHGPRPRGRGARAVTLVVVHSISLPPGEYGGDTVERLFANRLDHDAHPFFESLRGLRVSAHFFVRRGGEVLQFVSARRRAWHAGASAWRGRSGCNDFSIGIELEGLEGDRFEHAQYRALARLLHALAGRWPLRDVAGHEHVAPGRKHDPGPGFDWSLLARLLRRSPALCRARIGAPARAKTR